MRSEVTAPVKCYLHQFYGPRGSHCPACQDERDPPIRRTDVIEPPPEWAAPKAPPKCICKAPVFGPQSVTAWAADPMCPIHGFMQNSTNSGEVKS